MNNFEKMYNNDTVVPIEFDPSWSNGTGYYDNATTVQVSVGMVVKSFDTETKRKLLLTGTHFGTVVVFERYKEGQSGVYVSNWPRQIPRSFVRAIGGTSSLSQDTISIIVGGDGEVNIGKTLQQLFSAKV